MPSTTTYEFGDVVLVPFPFTDQSTSKQRPAVVVSSAAYHRARRRDLILLAITSQTRTSGFAGEASVVRWHEAGLLKPSAFKPVVATVERRLLRRKLGRLSSGDLQKLGRVLSAILGD